MFCYDLFGCFCLCFLLALTYVLVSLLTCFDFWFVCHFDLTPLCSDLDVVRNFDMYGFVLGQFFYFSLILDFVVILLVCFMFLL